MSRYAAVLVEYPSHDIPILAPHPLLLPNDMPSIMPTITPIKVAPNEVTPAALSSQSSIHNIPRKSVPFDPVDLARFATDNEHNHQSRTTHSPNQIDQQLAVTSPMTVTGHSPPHYLKASTQNDQSPPPYDESFLSQASSSASDQNTFRKNPADIPRDLVCCCGVGNLWTRIVFGSVVVDSGGGDKDRV